MTDLDDTGNLKDGTISDVPSEMWVSTYEEEYYQLVEFGEVNADYWNQSCLVAKVWLNSTSASNNGTYSVTSGVRYTDATGKN